VKKTISFLFKSAKPAHLLLSFFVCSCFTLAKSNGREVLAWRMSSEPDVRGYRVYCGATPASYSAIFETGSSNLFDLSVLEPGKRYYCAVTAVDGTGNESAFSSEVAFTPGAAPGPAGAPRISAVFPNPFRRSAAIWTVLDDSRDVRLTITDAAGRRVRTVRSGPVTGGAHGFIWDGMDDAGQPAAPGLYIATLAGDGRRQSRKLTLIR
jgi:hypothetical protein